MQPKLSVPPSQTEPKERRRVAWVTPDFPPDRGGVSDHSSAMVGVLRNAGHEVMVYARPHEQGFARLDAELKAYRPDLVVVAYTPLGYAPRTGGIAPAFTLWSVALQKRQACQAILLAHEASLPAASLWKKEKYNLAALGLAQVAQFTILAASFDAVIFSNMGTRRLWAQHLWPLAARFHAIRICSNIPYHFSNDPAAELAAAGHAVPSSTILFFGTGHQSALFDYLESAFLALLQVDPQAVLVIVGMTQEKLGQLSTSLAALGARVRALGYVAAPSVSLWLQVAKLVLAPLVEGVSARKGTVMAALQHGRTVITTRGVHTLDDIAWDEICVLAPLDPQAFAAHAVKALSDSDWRANIGRAARSEYEAHASVTVTAQGLMDQAARARDVKAHANHSGTSRGSIVR